MKQKKLVNNGFKMFTQITAKNADIRIPVLMHKKYITYHDTIDCRKYDYKKVIEQSKKSLNNVHEDKVIKMKLLFLLGYFATKECFDILTAYIQQNPQNPLRKWAILCLKDLQFTVESQFNEDHAAIMSPMGGKEHMNRCCVVIGAKHNKRLSAQDKKIIQADLYATSHNQYSRIETIEFGGNYVLFTLLISFDIAPQTVIDTFLDVISKEKHILKYHFFIVNTHKITKKEINKYLQMKEVKKL